MLCHLTIWVKLIRCCLITLCTRGNKGHLCLRDTLETFPDLIIVASVTDFLPSLACSCSTSNQHSKGTCLTKCNLIQNKKRINRNQTLYFNIRYVVRSINSHSWSPGRGFEALCVRNAFEPPAAPKLLVDAVQQRAPVHPQHYLWRNTKHLGYDSTTHLSSINQISFN